MAYSIRRGMIDDHKGTSDMNWYGMQSYFMFKLKFWIKYINCYKTTHCSQMSKYWYDIISYDVISYV